MKASKIRLLSPELVHRIAAGEVVENPASAMKELVENSIDAGATKVAVLIVDGGLKLIEVKDNGGGMSRADLEACCQRHATSKIREVRDLDHIFSLGFRGEALAALSSVSHLEILSREKGEKEAWVLKRQGAEFETQPVSHNEGTAVRVQDLFFNTPARKKFLKSPSSESSRCVKTFKDLAVSHCNVELSLHILGSNGELEEDLFFPAQDKLERMAAILSKEKEYFFHSSDQNLVPGLKNIEVMFLKAPHFARNSKDIYLVVNGRPVEDKRIAYVLREAFGGLIEMGAFPRGGVFLEVDASEVDVNVHPQKKELRWSKEFPLYSLIYEQVKKGLQAVMPKVQNPASSNENRENTPSLLGDFYSLPLQGGTESTSIERAFTSASNNEKISSSHEWPQTLQATASASNQIRFSSLRVVGEVGAAWLLCESDKGVIVIDQHAAHERVRFDELIKGRELFSAVPLLLPLKVELPLSLKGQEEAFVTLMEDWSFEGRVVSERQVEFFAVPKSARKIEWGETFEEIFDRMDQKLSIESLRQSLRVWIASSLACHGSVRRGQRLSNDEIAQLLKSMDEVDWKEFCPHGRPTWILLSHNRLEEEFHRS